MKKILIFSIFIVSLHAECIINDNFIDSNDNWTHRTNTVDCVCDSAPDSNGRSHFITYDHDYIQSGSQKGPDSYALVGDFWQFSGDYVDFAHFDYSIVDGSGGTHNLKINEIKHLLYTCDVCQENDIPAPAQSTDKESLLGWIPEHVNDITIYPLCNNPLTPESLSVCQDAGGGNGEVIYDKTNCCSMPIRCDVPLGTNPDTNDTNCSCSPPPQVFPGEHPVMMVGSPSFAEICSGDFPPAGGSNDEQHFGNQCMSSYGALRYGERCRTNISNQHECCTLIVCVVTDNNDTPQPHDTNDTPPPFDCTTCQVNDLCVDGACIPIPHSPDSNNSTPPDLQCDPGYYKDETDTCVPFYPPDNNSSGGSGGSGGSDSSGGNASGGGDSNISKDSNDSNLSLPQYEYKERNYKKQYGDFVDNIDYTANVPIVPDISSACDVDFDVAGVHKRIEFSKADSIISKFGPFVKYGFIFAAIWAVLAGGI